jgi:hypothetical protein
MRTPLEYFAPIVPEPDDYASYLPDFENAYICASMAQLARKEAVGAQHTDAIYMDAVKATLADWGVSGAANTAFINSRWIMDAAGNRRRPGTQGLLFFHEKTAFIVFRSTELKINDWFTDANIRLSGYDFGPGEVHAGFLSAFSQVVPDEGEAPTQVFQQVRKQLEEASAVWLTGHSLGGALASVAACWLLDQGIPVSGLYTFGAPRVGNAKYRDYMNARLGHRYWRFMHMNDIVPDLPLHIFRMLRILPNIIAGYTREGSAVRLNESGYDVIRRVTLDEVTNEWSRQVLQKYHGKNAADHKIDEYRSRLLAICRSDTPDFPEMGFVRERGAGGGSSPLDEQAIGDLVGD